MKKRILALSLGITILCSGSLSTVYAAGTIGGESETSSSSEELEYDFKTFCWGDVQSDVEQKEGEPYLESDMTNYDAHYIAYKTSVAGKDAILAYYFCDEGLFQTRYILQETHSNDSLYIDDYDDIRSALTKKYDEPLIDKEIWEDDSKKDYYASKKGRALDFGYLSYWTWYSLDRTDIEMNMSADNYEVSTTIDFMSKEISVGEADYSDDF